jgi:FkbM family methyltransferase
VVVDVGSNIGLVALWAARCVGPEGRVIGIDPSSWACERARRNAELSAISHAEFVHAAVGDTIGEADMQIINGYRVDDVDTSATEHVAFVTIDQVLEERGITGISLLKVDTDGYEVGVFRGAHRTLSTDRPDLVFELGPDHLRKTGNSVEVLIGLLQGYGYTFFDEAMQPVDPFVVAAALPKFETANLVGRYAPGTA